MNEPHTHTQVSCLIHQRAKNDLGQKKVVVVIKKFFSRFSGNFFFFFGHQKILSKHAHTLFIVLVCFVLCCVLCVCIIREISTETFDDNIDDYDDEKREKKNFFLPIFAHWEGLIRHHHSPSPSSI